jgi:hypothetical protein
MTATCRAQGVGAGRAQVGSLFAAATSADPFSVDAVLTHPAPLAEVAVSPNRCSHSDVPLYISLVIIHTKYTGVRQNDSNV